MSVIDTGSDQRRAHRRGRQVAARGRVDARGKTLIVGVYGEDRVALVDTTSSGRRDHARAKPHTIAVRPDGKLAYVSSQEPGKSRSSSSTSASRALTGTIPSTSPQGTSSRRGGKALYFTEAGTNAIAVLDPASDKSSRRSRRAHLHILRMCSSGAAYGTAVVQGPGRAPSLGSGDECPSGASRSASSLTGWRPRNGRLSVGHQRRSNDGHGRGHPVGATANVARREHAAEESSSSLRLQLHAWGSRISCSTRRSSSSRPRRRSPGSTTTVRRTAFNSRTGTRGRTSAARAESRACSTVQERSYV